MDTYEFNGFRLDLKKRTLVYREQLVSLPPKVMDTLIVLANNRGQLVTKEELLREVWQGLRVVEGGIHRNISILRETLGKIIGSKISFIETVPRRGYRFREENDSHSALQKPAAQAESSNKSIAVLPFKVIPRNKYLDYLGAGLADALANKLARFEQLTVRPASAVLVAAPPGHDVWQAAHKLTVDAVITGNLICHQEQITVNAQFLEVNSQKTLWSESFYAKSITDLSELQENIANQFFKFGGNE